MFKTSTLSTILAITLFVLSTFAAQGADIYVDDDNTEGPWDGTPEHPYQHIQDGINVAVSGDTVKVSVGVYEENITLKDGINLVGAGKEETIITASEGSMITADTVAEVTLEGFTIDGQDSGRYGIYCVNIEPSVRIHGNIIMNIWGDGIYCYYSSPTISNNTITEIVFDGIYLNWSGPSITNNIITYTSADF